MARFVRVIARDGDVLLNIESISWVHMAARTVCTSGVNGGGHGLLHLAPGEMERLVALIGGDNDDDR